ncbi:MAG: lycopene cyclase domain-containing protein [Elusimicrobiota bacterium]
MPLPDNPHPTRDPESGFSYRRGNWNPLWAIFSLPFLFVMIPLYRLIKHEVNLKAAFSSIAVFEVVLLIAEHYALMHGHWVYNEARILGPKVFGIPIEEPLIYYFFCPFMVIMMFHAVKKYLLKK